MKIVVFGATGMIGQAVLKEACQDPSIEAIVSVGRSELSNSGDKINSVILKDMFHQEVLLEICKDFDACLFCLGTTSLGKTEEEYTRITLDLTLVAAETMKKANPKMRFIYVCAQGADSSEQGRVMWARVRGKLENKLFRFGFASAHSLRPGYIQPLDGIRSRTKMYQVAYDLFGFIYPLLKKITPNKVTSTRNMGRAMLALARGVESKEILDPQEINRLAEMNH